MDIALAIFRSIFWCKRRIYKLFYKDDTRDSDRVNPTNLPWLWVGVQYDNEVVTVTEQINSMMYSDIRVTPEYLSTVTGVTKGTWKYIDKETLEERDFPSDGFVIKNE